MAEIAGVDVTQVNILEVKRPIAGAVYRWKGVDGEEVTGPQSGLDHSDTVDEFIQLSSDSYIPMDEFLEVRNASIVGLEIEIEIAAPSVGVAASINEKFEEALKKAG